GADRGIDDLADQASADGDAELRKQEAGNQRAADTDQDIADNSKTCALHDLSGQPARNQADEQNNQNAFVGNVHGTAPPRFTRISRPPRAYPIIACPDDPNSA